MKIMEVILIKSVSAWKTLKSWIVEDLGFESFSDLITSSLTLKSKFLLIHLYGMTLSGFITFFLYVSEQTETWIYKPFKGIGILLFVSIVDFLLGASNSISTKNENLQWQKIPRSGVRFALQCFFVGVFFNLNSIWPLIIHIWVVDGLLLIFILTTAWSSFENAYSLKLITKEQFEAVQQWVNIKKFLTKFKK